MNQSPETVHSRWQAWIQAFDDAVARDDWSALGEFLTDDVVYRVNGGPFDCVLRGREAVIAGFARSVRGFDHRCLARHWTPIGIRVYPAGYVTCRIHSGYRIDTQSLLSFEATGHWGFRGDRIDLMVDFYDAAQHDVQQAFMALAALGEHVDPRYCVD